MDWTLFCSADNARLGPLSPMPVSNLPASADFQKVCSPNVRLPECSVPRMFGSPNIHFTEL